MAWAIAECKGVIGEDGFREIILRGVEDQGTNFFRGLGKDGTKEIVEVTKKYLVWIWAFRQARVNLVGSCLV